MIYHNFALVYDKVMEHAPYDKWTSFLMDIIKKYNKDIQNILDIGCGTGEITTRLAAQNYEMYGVDLSSDMLAMAMEKSLHKQVHVTWIQQDVKQLTGFQDIDMAISFCDVFNYIKTENDLLKSFKNIYESLRDGSLFLFDVHGETYAKTKLMGHSFTDRDESISYIWDCEHSDIAGELIHHLSFFVQTDRDLYERFDETHVQRVFPLDTYKKLLQEANFSILNIYGDFSLDTDFSLENTERVFILAEKRAK